MPDSPSAKSSAAKAGSTGPEVTPAASQPAAGGKAEEAEAQNEPSAAAGDDDTVTSSAKEIFAAALEKKKSAGQSRSAHLDGHGGVGGATASHKATRTFRRKSG